MKRISTIILLAALISLPSNAKAAIDQLCFFGTNGAVGPTLIHLVDWTTADALVWDRAQSTTTVVPPPGITVANIPRVDPYDVTLLIPSTRPSSRRIPFPADCPQLPGRHSSFPSTISYFHPTST